MTRQERLEKIFELSSKSVDLRKQIEQMEILCSDLEIIVNNISEQIDDLIAEDMVERNKHDG